MPTTTRRSLVFQWLEADAPGPVGRTIRIALAALILLNVIALVIESHYEPGDPALHAFEILEAVSVSVFTVEYLLRLWSIVENPRYARALSGRVRFATSPLALVDLLAVLPFFVPFVTSVDLRVARLLRILRLLRVFKLGRYSAALQLLLRVLQRKKADLASTLMVVAIVLVIASSLMFFAEHGERPDVFPDITSAFWWGVAALTTVGYGDLVPVTVAGKVIGGIIAVLGVGVFALPAGIIASGYMELLQETRAAAAGPDKSCPDCAESVKVAARVCRFCGYRWPMGSAERLELNATRPHRRPKLRLRGRR